MVNTKLCQCFYVRMGLHCWLIPNNNLRRWQKLCLKDSNFNDIQNILAIPSVWTVVLYKAQFLVCRDVERFVARFLDWHKANMYYRKDMKCDMIIGCWNRKWASLRVWFPGFVYSREILDMPLFRHKNGQSYVQCFLLLMCPFDKETRFIALGLCCSDFPLNCFFLVYDAESLCS